MIAANPSSPGPRSFGYQVLTDLFEPEIPARSHAIVDPDCEPKDGDFVLVKLQFERPEGFVRLTVFKRPSRPHDDQGRFCKRGDPRESFGLAFCRYTRADAAEGLVTILGTVHGWVHKNRFFVCRDA